MTLTRFSRSARVMGLVSLTALSWSGAAHALCMVTTADYDGGSFGAQVVASQGACFRTPVGGQGQVTAQESFSQRGSTAALASGTLTARSSSGSASAALWDTITFQGLPAAGAQVTAYLGLGGQLTGGGTASARLSVVSDPAQRYDPALGASMLLSAGDAIPARLSYSFTAHNGDSFLVLAQLTGQSFGGLADLGAPARLSFALPAQASFTSSSGVFLTAAPVPEPATVLMMAAGLLAVLAWGRRTHRR